MKKRPFSLQERSGFFRGTKDVLALSRQDRKKHFWAIGGAFLITGLVITMFLVEHRWGYLKPDPLLIFVDSWTEKHVQAKQAKQSRKKPPGQKKQKNSQEIPVAAKKK